MRLCFRVDRPVIENCQPVLSRDHEFIARKGFRHKPQRHVAVKGNGCSDKRAERCKSSAMEKSPATGKRRTSEATVICHFRIFSVMITQISPFCHCDAFPLMPLGPENARAQTTTFKRQCLQSGAASDAVPCKTLPPAASSSVPHADNNNDFGPTARRIASHASRLMFRPPACLPAGLCVIAKTCS